MDPEGTANFEMNMLFLLWFPTFHLAPVSPKTASLAEISV